MRYVFIVNPKAGKRGRALEWLPRIQAYFGAHPEAGEYRLHITQAPGEATRLAKEASAEAERTGMPLCLVACGGDGTLMETAGGMAGGAEVRLACLPCGSANDFIRCFGTAEEFADLDVLVHGRVRMVDAIRCGQALSLNLCSMGMDADVADKMTKYKGFPLVSGSLAYELAIVDVFCHRIGKHLQVEMDTPEGTVRRAGRYFFALAASGQYYGGGYRGAPDAVPDDGLLDFVLIKAMPRIRIPGFLKRYKRGLHVGMDICEVLRGTAMRVTSREEAAVNLDGECFRARETAFAVEPGRIPFVLPQ